MIIKKPLKHTSTGLKLNGTSRSINQLFLEFWKTDSKRHKSVNFPELDEETDDYSNETPIVSANEALKSLENIKTFLIQQEGTSSYLKAVNSLEKFIQQLGILIAKFFM